jgi:hypothetical protein
MTVGKTGRFRSAASAAAVLTLILASAATVAQEKWYTVELVIFERTSGAGLSSELWPETVDEPSLGLVLSSDGNNSVGLLDTGSQRGEMIQPVRRADLAYRDIASRMRRSGRYRVLAHRGWRQPAVDKTQALPVSIGARPSRRPLGSGEALSTTAGQASTLVAAEPSIRGTVRLYVARYLHLEAQLLYKNPLLGEQAHFELRESRRMRSGELHYFDHPMFGMLLRATPYQPPGGEYLPAPSDASPAPTPTTTEPDAQPATPPAQPKAAASG